MRSGNEEERGLGEATGGWGVGAWAWEGLDLAGTATSPETFMDPESCDAGLGIVEVPAGSQHALEHLGKGRG